MFGLFDIFDENPQNTNPRKHLMDLTRTEFSPLPSTRLEKKHSLAFELIHELNIENSTFDNQYNIIIAGTIIYALAHETSYYSNSKGPLINYYSISMQKLFEHCKLPIDCPVDHKDLIVKLGEKAINEKSIPFDETTIKTYFSGKRGTLKGVLLDRFKELDLNKVQDQGAECTLF
jgi:hypothetical protein